MQMSMKKEEKISFCCKFFHVTEGTLHKHANQSKEKEHNYYQSLSNIPRDVILENDLHNTINQNELCLCYQP